MQYVMLVYGNEAAWAEATPEQREASLAAFGAFHEEMMARGNMVAAERLQSSQTATTVRVREGKTLTTDGPFAETKEQIGGFYIFECEHLDEALEIAAKIPTAKSGTIEVRPVFEAEGES